MIEYMIQFANNFEADCRDGFVSNDEAYTELAIEGIDLDKKLRKWCEENDLVFPKLNYVELLVRFARDKSYYAFMEERIFAEAMLEEFYENQ